MLSARTRSLPPPWGDRAIGDDTLAGAVSRLRRALGGTRERRYIETVPKRGYRAVVESPPPGRGPRAAADGPPEAAALVAQGFQALVPAAADQPGPGAALLRGRVATGGFTAHQGLAEALIIRQYMEQGGDLLAAKAAARAAVGLDETSAAAWATLGSALLLADRDFTAAEAAFQRAIALDPTLVIAHRRRAGALTAVGRFAEAERSARRAVDLLPNSLEARSELLEILLIARRYRHAAAEAVATLSVAADLGQAWYVRGWALAMSGDEAEGLECLLKGLGPGVAARERLPALRPSSKPRASRLAAARRPTSSPSSRSTSCAAPFPSPASAPSPARPTRRSVILDAVSAATPR